MTDHRSQASHSSQAHPASQAINPLERARLRAEAQGRLRSLISSNFRQAGLSMPESLYREVGAAAATLRSGGGLPQSGRGPDFSRAAVAEWLTRDGLPTSPDSLVLTSGSSISYFLLFRALREQTSSHLAGPTSSDSPGTVAIPRPGYPLFEQIASHAGLRTVEYALDLSAGGEPDLSSVQSLLQSARPPLGLLLISPSNPTGAITSAETLEALHHLCAQSGTVIISDEVFSAYRPAGSRLPRPARTASDASEAPAASPAVARPGSLAQDVLVVTINGLSKLCAAPELKAGWMAVHGPDARVHALLEDLDTAHDAYLTLSAHSAAALQIMLSQAAAAARTDIADTVRHMRGSFYEARTESRREVDWLSPLVTEGGIHIAARIDSGFAPELDDEQLAIRLLEDTGLYVHPGYLYGFPDDERWWVMSCLMQPDELASAMAALRRWQP